jgi:hypothetical protein
MLTPPELMTDLERWFFGLLVDEQPELPDWARRLTSACPGYCFATQRVYRGRSVVARRVAGGPGPFMVIGGSEEDFRTALHLDAAATTVAEVPR